MVNAVRGKNVSFPKYEIETLTFRELFQEEEEKKTHVQPATFGPVQEMVT